MLLQNTSLASLTIATSLPVDSKTWQVGQILQAIVRGRDQQGRLEIRIGNNTLTATTPKVYQAGQTLKLQVVDVRETLVLQNLEPGRAATKRPMVEQLLRHALPKQGKLQVLVFTPIFLVSDESVGTIVEQHALVVYLYGAILWRLACW